MKEAMTIGVFWARSSDINALENLMHRIHAIVLSDDKIKISAGFPKNAGPAKSNALVGGYMNGKFCVCG